MFYLDGGLRVFCIYLRFSSKVTWSWLVANIWRHLNTSWESHGTDSSRSLDSSFHWSLFTWTLALFPCGWLLGLTCARVSHRNLNVGLENDWDHTLNTVLSVLLVCWTLASKLSDDSEVFEELLEDSSVMVSAKLWSMQWLLSLFWVDVRLSPKLMLWLNCTLSASLMVNESVWTFSAVRRFSPIDFLICSLLENMVVVVSPLHILVDSKL